MHSKKSQPSNKSVIVIGEKEDKHLPFVGRHLSTPMIVIDAATIASGKELSYTFHKAKTRITYKDQSLDSVCGVWLRGRRIERTIPVPVTPLYEEYSRSAVMRHTEALYTQLQKAHWVSDYYAIQRAGYKPLQLQVATSLGFRVPHTIFTSSPAKAKKFIASYPVTITKPIGVSVPGNKKRDSVLIFHATKIRKSEKIDLSGLTPAPAIFQQAIDHTADLRVTVVGDKIFPAIIIDEKLDPDSPIRDWRVGHYTEGLNIESYKLPKDIADKCIALVKELGLQYGAIDLVIDKKSQIWFLEINPNGQWAFIEEATGQPLGKAMADLLQG